MDLQNFLTAFFRVPMDLESSHIAETWAFIEKLESHQIKEKLIKSDGDPSLIGYTAKQKEIVQQNMPFWMALYATKLFSLISDQDCTTEINQIIKNYDRASFLKE
ncbi:MAG TPA: hypothetical protein PKY82_35705 [Pyrinomonadaceae bacterium]|nr:hypothetical protein [Pyrinomonadaceae bacterium]